MGNIKLILQELLEVVCYMPLAKLKNKKRWYGFELGKFGSPDYKIQGVLCFSFFLFV